MKQAKTLSTEDVLYLARLANLKLTDQEINEFKGQLTKIIKYIDEIQKLPLNGVKTTSQVTDKSNEFRLDEVKNSISQKSALSQAKRTYKGYFVTASVFKNE